MKAFFVGNCDYKRILALQQVIFEKKIKRQIAVQRSEVSLPLLPDVTIMVEHLDHVYTVGRRDTTKGLPEPCDIAVVKTRRGGGVTYHGPGQLAVYPIANVQMLWKRCTTNKVRSPIEWFSHVLECAMMDTAAHYGIPTHAYKTGVWSKPCEGEYTEKIGSIGLHLGSWVSMHGISFNVCPELAYFDRIVMCEMPNKKATSLAKEIERRRLPIKIPSTGEIAPILLNAIMQRLAQPIEYNIAPLVDLSDEKELESALLLLSGYLAAPN